MFPLILLSLIPLSIAGPVRIIPQLNKTCEEVLPVLDQQALQFFDLIDQIYADPSELESKLCNPYRDSVKYLENYAIHCLNALPSQSLLVLISDLKEKVGYVCNSDLEVQAKYINYTQCVNHEALEKCKKTTTLELAYIRDNVTIPDSKIRDMCCSWSAYRHCTKESSKQSCQPEEIEFEQNLSSNEDRYTYNFYCRYYKIHNCKVSELLPSNFSESVELNHKSPLLYVIDLFKQLNEHQDTLYGDVHHEDVHPERE